MSALGRRLTSKTPRRWRLLKNDFPARVTEIREELAPGTSVEVWFQDEMRVGQKNKLTYRWAKTGSRPRADHDQRTQSAYLFGAVCPDPQRPTMENPRHRSSRLGR